MTYPLIDIGRLIQKKMEEKGMNKAQLAKKMGMQRQNINTLVFAKDSLASDLIRKASLALDYNFFADFFISDNNCAEHFEQHGDHSVMAKEIQTVEVDKRQIEETEIDVRTSKNQSQSLTYEELKVENSKLKDQLIESKNKIIELMENKR